MDAIDSIPEKDIIKALELTTELQRDYMMSTLTRGLLE
jgi:hypothetical protein